MNTTNNTDTRSAVQLASQVALAQRMLTFPAETLRDAQERRLASRLTPAQAEAIDVYMSNARQAISVLDTQANEAAMKTLLTPNDARHRVRAFFAHAKARAMEFGLLQFESVLLHCEGSFAEFIDEVHCSQDGCQRSHMRQAAAHARALVGQDPSTDGYAAMRTEAACAQGREEAYGDLAELFEVAVSGVDCTAQ